jgi:hypothetical protein
MQQPGILQPAEADSTSIGRRRFTEQQRAGNQDRRSDPIPPQPPPPPGMGRGKPTAKKQSGRWRPLSIPADCDWDPRMILNLFVPMSFSSCGWILLTFLISRLQAAGRVDETLCVIVCYRYVWLEMNKCSGPPPRPRSWCAAGPVARLCVVSSAHSQIQKIRMTYRRATHCPMTSDIEKYCPHA